MTLFTYLSFRFIRMLFLVLLAFVVLQILLDTIEHLRRFGDRDYGIAALLRLVALNLPTGLYEIMPLVVLLAAIASIRGLARSSELVIIRATGRSVTRALLPPLLVTLMFGTLVVAVVNPLVATTARSYSDHLAMLDGSLQSNALELSAEGLWLRQADGEGFAIVRAIQVSQDASALFNVSIWRSDKFGREYSRIEAQRAIIVPGQWRLEGVKAWPIESGLNPETNAQELDGMVLPTTLTREQLIEGVGVPNSIPIWELPAFIERLENAGLSALRHKIWLHMEMARPVFFVALALIGAAFSMQHARAQRTGLMILGAVLSGFFLFYLRNFAQVLGENGQAPLLLAAWGPPVAALLMAVGLILTLEDG